MKKIFICIGEAIIFFGTLYILSVGLNVFRTFHFFPAVFALFSVKARWITWLIIFLILTFFYIFWLGTKSATNPIIKEDNNGVLWLKNGTQGTAHELSENEIREIYRVENIDKYNNAYSDEKGNKKGFDFVYGQIGDDGKKIVSFKDNQYHSGNKISLVLGASGTGKSFCLINNNIIQAAINGHSIVVTDPKGELYQNFAQFLIDKGYKVKLFNLLYSDYSDSWNCIKECIDPVTGEFDSERAKDFATTFMVNSSGTPGEIKEDFWYNAALSLLQALLGICAWRYEHETKKKYEKIVCKALENQDVSVVQEVLNTCKENASLNQFRKNILELLVECGYSDDEADKIVKAEEDKIENKFTIQGVYDFLMKNKEISKLKQQCDNMLAKDPSMANSFAYKMYYTFDVANVQDSVKGSVIQNLQIKLGFLAEPRTAALLSYDDIDLALPGYEKCAYFCLMSDKSDSKKIVSSLFFTFLFKDLMDGYDRCTEGEKKNRKEIFLLMDEFFSIGAVPGIEIYFSTCRSRKLSPVMVLQNLFQLDELYGETVGANILTIPETIIFLGSGAGDDRTPELLSKLAGKGTVRSNTVARESLFGNVSEAPFDINRVSESETAREVLTVDEVRSLGENELLVIKRGVNVAKLQRFGYIFHPEYKVSIKGKSISIFEHERLSKKHNILPDHDYNKYNKAKKLIDKSRINIRRPEELFSKEEEEKEADKGYDADDVAKTKIVQKTKPSKPGKTTKQNSSPAKSKGTEKRRKSDAEKEREREAIGEALDNGGFDDDD